MKLQSLDMHLFFTFYYAAIFLSFFSESSIASDSITLNQSISRDETLVSSGQRFELGFFNPSNSQNQYLGIWHKYAPDAVVWVANRDNPIKDSYGVLTIRKTEGLVLLSQTGSIIWSSNSSIVTENPVAKLLDSGNLVLVDDTSTSSESDLWQSFNYPSNSWLPGMKLGWNEDTDREQYLTSWKNTQDPSSGDFTYKIKSDDGLPQMVISKGAIKKFRSGPWHGDGFNGFFYNVSNPIFPPILVHNEDNSYNIMYENSNHLSSTRVTLNQSGIVQRYIMKEGSTQWDLMYTTPKDQCDNYRQCGANSICRSYKSLICECLKGFIPKSQEAWSVLDWSSGCTRRTPLNCQNRDKFMKVKAVKFPDLLNFRLEKSMKLKECKAECLKNCSCTAYANSNIASGGRGCLMWFGDLIDIRDFIEEYMGQDIYTRLAASEIDSVQNSNKKKRLAIILVGSTISGMLVLGLLYRSIIWKKRKLIRGEDWELPLFDRATIATATNNFAQANMLGQGGFGSVYKANLPTGQELAVKRLSKVSGQGFEEFKNEIVSISKLQHRNLVRLLGCCVQGEERMLIYEFMPNKSLDYFIFDNNNSTVLCWKERFDIGMGIARGLLYLHQDSRLKIIHRDLKASNILLDSNLNPKISDFGLARIFGGDENYAKTKRVVGTYGYMSPEYAIDGTFSAKSDVFSFGVLLLEIISGKRNRGFSHPDHHHSLLGHALEVLDPRMKNSYVESQVLRCVQVGLLCVQKLPTERPTMSAVVSMLGNEGLALCQPKQPGFFIERSSIETKTILFDEVWHSQNAVTITLPEAR
ncbi:G-type lectin S-receptor-like serine/threonine-protein kinase At4g27290 isoform X2 [Actinidia eriantha]|uniref:G-type lectin S-receptor-like serine/threonine-protein kinase At4g27290 isoform X2 n=1 Tax=Actinidia eriantha TaxID=165200 RepID=UPI0025853DC2|nr:G-type lectin S-receptor-like serine/threonine-protein kinase At4g27290 isoform X2 [Actinidia eriantha]